LDDTHAQPLLPALEIETGTNPQRAVIWMHGLGADGNDFESVVDEMDLSGLPPIRFVFPHAPMRPITINNGYVMRAWYDLVSLDFSQRREDPSGMRVSALQIEALIARENARGIADEHIVLAGFSQGGALALHTALRHPQPLAGVLALSTYLPLADSLEAEAHASNKATPIFMAHGHYDGVIPFDFARQSAEFLKAQHYAVEWHEYAMEHSLSLQELRDFERWLRARLA